MTKPLFKMTAGIRQRGRAPTIGSWRRHRQRRRVWQNRKLGLVHSRANIGILGTAGHTGGRERSARTLSRGRDFADFPEFYAEYFPTQGFRVRSAAITTVCNGPIRYIGQTQVQRDIANLQQALAKVKVVDGFLPVVAPGSAFQIPGRILQRRPVPFMGARRSLREEYKTILDAGLRIQIDDAFLPWTYERIVPPMTMRDYQRRRSCGLTR